VGDAFGQWGIGEIIEGESCGKEPDRPGRLDGKVVLIEGAGRGRRHAVRLAQEGVDIEGSPPDECRLGLPGQHEQHCAVPQPRRIPACPQVDLPIDMGIRLQLPGCRINFDYLNTQFF
jgi:hypothetical protein